MELELLGILEGKGSQAIFEGKGSQAIFEGSESVRSLGPKLDFVQTCGRIAARPPNHTTPQPWHILCRSHGNDNGI